MRNILWCQERKVLFILRKNNLQSLNAGITLLQQIDYFSIFWEKHNYWFWTLLQGRHGYDSESNHWSTISCFLQSWVDLNKKWRSILSHESIWINTWGTTWIMSWFGVTCCNAAWDMSWIDSCPEIPLDWWADSNQFLGKTLQSKAQKGHTRSTLEWKTDCNQYSR